MTVPGGSGCPGSWIAGARGGFGECRGGLADTGMKREGWTKSRSIRRRIPLFKDLHQNSQGTPRNIRPQKESYGRTPPSVWITGHEVPFFLPFQQWLGSVKSVRPYLTMTIPFAHLRELADFASGNVSAGCYPEVGKLHQEIK